MPRFPIIAAATAAWTVFACTSTTSAPGEPPNVALEGTVTASAFWENNPSVSPEKAINGSTYEDSGSTDFWLLPNRTAGWWQVDLGREFKIVTVRIRNTHNGHGNDRATKDFRLEIQDSAQAVVFSFAGALPFQNRSSAANPIVPYDVKPKKAAVGRYVKIYVDSWYPTRSDSTWPHPVFYSGNLANEGGGLNEVQVLGTPK